MWLVRFWTISGIRSLKLEKLTHPGNSELSPLVSDICSGGVHKFHYYDFFKKVKVDLESHSSSLQECFQWSELLAGMRLKGFIFLNEWCIYGYFII